MSTTIPSQNDLASRPTAGAPPVTTPVTDPVTPVLKGRGLVKRYGSVTAMDHADFDLMPGEILAVSDEGITIAAAGGAILAKRVRGEGGAKIPGAEFAALSGLKVGDKLDAAEPKKSA